DLVKLLAGERRNLAVCGDDDQSIYKFRGASISNILEFKKDFPDSVEVVLTRNYRSKQKILDLAYRFIQLNNPNRLEAQLNGAITRPNLKIRITKQLFAERGKNGKIEHFHYSTHEEEAWGVVGMIDAMKRAEPDRSWNDFAILVRANDHADLFTQALERAQIPFQFMASKGLFRQPDILDVLSYLRLLDNYHESRALFRVLQLPVFGISSYDVVNLLNTAARKSLSLFEVLHIARTIPRKISPKGLDGIDRLLQLLERHAVLARSKPAGLVIYTFLKDVGLLSQIASESEGEAQRRANILNQFMKTVETFERGTRDPSVRNFVGQMDLAQEAGDEGTIKPDWDEGPQSVRVMTVHAAKGLEFPLVFLVNLVDQRFPTRERRDAIELPEALVREILPDGDVHLQEERRLFYVAITRARDHLILTSAADYGGARKKKLSRFLIEAGLATDPHQEGIARGEKNNEVDEPRQSPVEAQPVIEIPKIFSYTQLRVFETCPYQYRFTHLLKIRVPGRFTFSYGKTMHATLQKFFQRIKEQRDHSQISLFDAKKFGAQDRIPSLEDLLEIYEECWQDDWYQDRKQKEEYRKRGRETLKEFYEKHQGVFPTPLFLEKSFTISIDGVRVRGAIDRIDPITKSDQHGVRIIDYKTGKVPKSETDLTLDQLLLYAIASREILGSEPLMLTFYYLDENRPFDFDVDEKKITRLREKIKSLVEQISKSDFRATPGYHCRSCDYYEICPFRKAK
ncbi:MAG: ATP-dependent DNA helicase, partial [Patescibacteria group bacterium]